MIKAVLVVFFVIIEQALQIPKTKKCTPGACILCTSNGQQVWCKRCGNGHYLSNKKEGEGRCLKKITIPNCYESSRYDTTNPKKCSKCMRGYFLNKNRTRCHKFVNFDCDMPYKWVDRRFCGGCRFRWLSDDLMGCEKDGKGLPANCDYGDTRRSRRCKKCKPGYILSKDGKKCEKFTMAGCMRRDSKNPDKCLVCDHDLGYYAVGAEFDSVSGFVSQRCEFFRSNLPRILFIIGLIFTGLVW